MHSHSTLKSIICFLFPQKHSKWFEENRGQSLWKILRKISISRLHALNAFPFSRCSVVVGNRDPSTDAIYIPWRFESNCLDVYQTMVNRKSILWATFSSWFLALLNVDHRASHGVETWGQFIAEICWGRSFLPVGAGEPGQGYNSLLHLTQVCSGARVHRGDGCHVMLFSLVYPSIRLSLSLSLSLPLLAHPTHYLVSVFLPRRGDLF